MMPKNIDLWDMSQEEFNYLKQLLGDYRKILVEQFDKEYTKSLDRFFIIGYLDLKAYLNLRASRGESTKFSKIVKLLVKRIIRFIGVD